MNKVRLLELADHLETLTHHPDDGLYDEVIGSEKFFNLSAYTFECEAPACIAGHAAAMFSDLYDVDIHDEAELVLDLTTKQADNLFLPSLHKVIAKRMIDVTPQEAAKVVRHFAETEKIDWSIINVS